MSPEVENKVKCGAYRISIVDQARANILGWSRRVSGEYLGYGPGWVLGLHHGLIIGVISLEDRRGLHFQLNLRLYK